MLIAAVTVKDPIPPELIPESVSLSEIQLCQRTELCEEHPGRLNSELP